MIGKLYTIKQTAKILNVNEDTLRNWEEKGLISPLRVGLRKDRKYTDEILSEIVKKGLATPFTDLNKDLEKKTLTLSQLESFLWKSADILRGKIDSSDYKKYIFGLLFYKRMSDVWDEEYKKVIDEYDDESIAIADYNHRFQVPKDCRWNKITEHAENIGQKLNEIFDKLTNANSPKLDKIFDDLDFANKDRFPNETLQRLINHFSQYNFGDTYISSDLLGDAYEYLIKQFAADAGKKGGEFYTPREVEKVIMGIVKPHQKDHIYDPTVGSAGFLLEAYDYLKQKSGEKIAKTLYLYGQEQELATFAIARINMFLHGLDSADIRRGDTLANPQFLNQQGNLQTFDIVVANPPYSIKDWEYEAFKNRYGRIDGYEMPPVKNADYAFVLHIIKSMNANGRAGIVLPHGVLFRGGAEARIREQILKNDLIETIVSIPSKLFYGTGIPAIIMILNKNKSEEKKNKVLIIDAEKDYLEGKNQNSLRPQDINKIVKAHDNYQDIEKYARVVSLKEIEENDYNLNIRQYIDPSEKEEVIDVKEVRKEIQTIKKELAEVDKQVEKYLDGLNY
ncbi:MAG: type I restriction-modification system subunit M [Candidatus Paceibacterota bacterium]|jgi:type I restriction enzyme M protein